ncbi:hypothetical protein [Streptomyces sp. NBC_00209]|uniref:hypothetical protein n=1 Tax=Streptomyces sp. NBC_00209 TaxID=2975682 RepID=UPI003244D850
MASPPYQHGPAAGQVRCGRAGADGDGYGGVIAEVADDLCPEFEHAVGWPPDHCPGC